MVSSPGSLLYAVQNDPQGVADALAIAPADYPEDTRIRDVFSTAIDFERSLLFALGTDIWRIRKQQDGKAITRMSGEVPRTDKSGDLNDQCLFGKFIFSSLKSKVTIADPPSRPVEGLAETRYRVECPRSGINVSSFRLAVYWGTDAAAESCDLATVFEDSRVRGVRMTLRPTLVDGISVDFLALADAQLVERFKGPARCHAQAVSPLPQAPEMDGGG